MKAAAIVLFDGTCNFCNGAVRFIIANDPAARFRFAPSQSDGGIAALREVGRDQASVQSIVMIDGDGYHERSDAALGIAAGLRAPWRALSILRAVPAPLRDFGYDIIARNRHRLFGRRDSCALPTPAEQARFL